MPKIIENLAYFLTGQGSQQIGMWGKLVESSAAREIFRIAGSLIPDLPDIVANGPLEKLTLTSNTQPAILANGLGALAAAREQNPQLVNINPAFVFGHSVGEYLALVEAGVISIEAGIRLTRARGLVMLDARDSYGEKIQGGMTAVLGIDVDLIRKVIRGKRVEIGNDNSYGEVVLTGDQDDLNRVSAKLLGLGARKVIPLTVSMPFHYSALKHAQKIFADYLDKEEFHNARIPVVMNVTAEPCIDGGEIRDLMKTQFSSPVRCREALAYMLQNGVTQAIEFGPNPRGVINGFFRNVAKHLGVAGISAIAVSDLQSAQNITIQKPFGWLDRL